jgi:hypothetical protein
VCACWAQVRTLISVDELGTVWSGSSGKGGTHVWDATALPVGEVASHSQLQSLVSQEGLHLVCGTAVRLPAAAGAGAAAGGGGAAAGAAATDASLTVWTGHTNGRVAQWDPVRGAAALMKSWQAHADGRWCAQWPALLTQALALGGAGRGELR